MPCVWCACACAVIVEFSRVCVWDCTRACMPYTSSSLSIRNITYTQVRRSRPRWWRRRRRIKIKFVNYATQFNYERRVFVVFILEGGLTNIKVRSAVYCGGGGWQHIFVYTYLQPFYTEPNNRKKKYIEERVYMRSACGQMRCIHALASCGPTHHTVSTLYNVYIIMWVCLILSSITSICCMNYVV